MMYYSRNQQNKDVSNGEWTDQAKAQEAKYNSERSEE